MSNKIKLKVSPRTIYTDIKTLPDTLMLGLTIRWYNQSDITLYFKFEVSGTGWSSNTETLGSLSAGSNSYKHLDNFTSRSKPSSETTDTLTCTLKAYTDSNYTDLYTQFSRNVTVVMIKSDDGTWTEDVLNNFDDGTVQGWSVALEDGLDVTLAAATDYVLSSLYSLKATQGGQTVGIYSREQKFRIYKSFTTPNRTTVYAIFNIRLNSYVEANASAWSSLKNLTFLRDSTTLTFLGKPTDSSSAEYLPKNKWIRVVLPLPSNSTVQLKVVLSSYFYNSTSYRDQYIYLWQDDFRIISRN